jgi:hypothetical protein
MPSFAHAERSIAVGVTGGATAGSSLDSCSAMARRACVPCSPRIRELRPSERFERFVALAIVAVPQVAEPAGHGGIGTKLIAG